MSTGQMSAQRNLDGNDQRLISACALGSLAPTNPPRPVLTRYPSPGTLPSAQVGT